MDRLRFFSLPLVLVCALFVWSGCSNDDDGGDGGTPVNVDSLVTQANSELESALNDLINGDEPQGPADINFSEPYALYTEALRSNPNHPTALFGVGMLDVLMLMQDAEVQDLYDRMQAFLDAGTYFEVGGPAVNQPPRITPVFALADVRLPVLEPIRMSRRMTRTLDDDPQLSEVQNLCMSKLMPRLDQAVNHLAPVAANAEFTFTVTPTMQGDPLEDPVEIDPTEVRLTIAGLRAIQALLYQFCAYNMDLDAYDGPGMLEAFSQGSNFMHLNGQGSQRMRSARTAWLAAADYVAGAIDFLEAETDPQADDLIRIDPYDTPTQNDLDSIRLYLPRIETTLNSSYVWEIDTDGDEFTPPEQIEISLVNFFDSPVTDIKDLFPAYTVALDTQVIESNWVFDDSSVTAQIQIAAAAYHHWNRSASFSYGELQWEYRDSTFAAPAWNAAFAAIAQQVSSSSWAYVNCSYYNWLEAGTHTLDAYLHWEYEEAGRSRYTPRITWQAQSFAQWILPDPTVSGLFPGMTDARFKELFDLTADGWERTSTWYLW